MNQIINFQGKPVLKIYLARLQFYYIRSALYCEKNEEFIPEK